MDPAIIIFGLRHRRTRRHDRHGRWIPDDAAADPDLRDPADDRDRHRHLLRGGDQDRRRLAPPAHEDGQHGAGQWLAAGSVPAAVAGVGDLSVLQDHIGEDRLDSLVYALLGGTLLMVGIITLARALILSNLVEERDDFEVERRHKVAAVAIGATTGFVIGITSAGSGTVIAILLIAVFRLAPKQVVGTDVFHAAILLWAAGIAHWVGGNVDFALAGNILLGSVPGVVIGAALAARAPQGFLRTALGVVLVGSGIVTVQKGDPNVWPIAAAVAGIGLGWHPRRAPLVQRAAARRQRKQPLAPLGAGAGHDRLTD